MNIFLRVIIVISLILHTSYLFAQSDVEIIKQRVFESLVDKNVSDKFIEKLLNTFEDGKWPEINYNDTSRTGFEHRFHSNNIVTLARAYKQPASGFYQSQKVKSTIVSALKTWVDNDFICANWWHNQIGTPGDLVSLMLLVGDELPEELVKRTQPIIGRANTEAPGARPGGDRIKMAGIEAKNMLFLENGEQFGEIIKIIENEIKHVEWIGDEFGYGFRDIKGGFENRTAEGRGIQYDDSFHHRTDGVNNTLSYGIGYAAAFVEWAVFTRETTYEFSDEKLNELIDYYLDGICKMAVFGKYPDPGAKNRSISRPGTLKPYNAEIVERLLLTTDYRQDELREIAAIRKNETKPTRSHATFYPDSEHFSFQRPGFYTSVRMYSTRLHNMEWPYNSEGLLNHHRGDGVNHISVTGKEYFDIWPVYDYQKIPGTTVMQKPELPASGEIQKLGKTDFVGAVTDGLYGAVAFDFKSPHDPLIARKSWFFFDKEYMCLGAGISCKNDSLPVATTINQCLLNGGVHVSWDQERGEIPKGEREFPDTSWIYHDNVGYVFPQITPTNPKIKNESVAGSWWRINLQTDSPKDTIQHDVFKLWIDHGTRPSNATYEYIVLPAATLEETSNYLSSGRIRILSNTPSVQAVQNNETGIFQAVFYEAGKIQLSEDLELTVHNPGIVMVKTGAGKITEISVADPNQELTRFQLSASDKIKSEGENYLTFWKKKQQTTDILIDLPSGVHAGKSVVVNLSEK